MTIVRAADAIAEAMGWDDPQDLVAEAEAEIEKATGILQTLVNDLMATREPLEALTVLGRATVETLKRFPADQREAIQVAFIDAFEED